MKNIITILLMALTGPLIGFTQTQPRREVIRTDEQRFQLNEMTSFHFQYLLDEFTDGKIYLKGNPPVETAINYNILMDAIQYYDENDILLTVSRDLPVDSVVVGNHLLVPVHEQGFMEPFQAGKGSVYLQRSIIYYAEILKIGPYGAIERTSAIDKVNTINKAGLWGRDVVISNTPRDDIEIRMRYQQVFYFPAADGTFVELSSRKSILQAFPEHSSQIKRFMRQNKIDLNSPEPVVKLAEFLHGL